MRRNPALAVLSAGALLGLACLYLAPVFSPIPPEYAAREDLDLLREWQRSGRLLEHQADPDHLIKPGFLLWLGTLLPHAGDSEKENRRVPVINGIAILGSIVAACVALRRRQGMTFFLAFVVFLLPVRDSADYVAGEPMAAATALVFGAALTFANWKDARWRLGLGAAATLAAFFRPNLCALLLMVVLVVAWSAGVRGAAVILSIPLGFCLALGALWLAVSASGLPGSPLGAGVSRVLLWGTADYYWAPDVGGWPIGSSAEETARLQRAKALKRWNSFFRNWNTDKERSFLWRLGHGILSSEELPPRWRAPAYLAMDRFVREWWWAFSILAVSASVAAALGSRSEWRLVPILLVAASVTQGMVFGSDPRLVLPLWPLIGFSLAIALSAWSGTRRAVLGGAATALLLGAVVWRVPDVAAFDFAIVRGPGRLIEQRIPASRFPKSGEATVHLRLMQPRPFGLGLEIAVDGEPRFRRDPSSGAPYPAFFSILLDPSATANARHRGVTLQIRTYGAETPENLRFAYYPVVPPLLGRSSTIDGEVALPSGFGGSTRGGLPVWVHAGTDGLDGGGDDGAVREDEGR